MATTSTPKGADSWPEEFLRKNAETTEAQRYAHAAGVVIVYGTDAGV